MTLGCMPVSADGVCLVSKIQSMRPRVWHTCMHVRRCWEVRYVLHYQEEGLLLLLCARAVRSRGLRMEFCLAGADLCK